MRRRFISREHDRNTSQDLRLVSSQPDAKPKSTRCLRGSWTESDLNVILLQPSVEDGYRGNLRFIDWFLMHSCDCGGLGSEFDGNGSCSYRRSAISSHSRREMGETPHSGCLNNYLATPPDYDATQRNVCLPPMHARIPKEPVRH